MRIVHTTLLLGATMLITAGAVAQAPSAAIAPSRSAQAGFSLSYGTTDFGTKNVVGVGVYGTYDFLPHFGAEVDVHSMSLIADQDIVESTFLAGVRYFYPIRRYRPFVKLTAGIGHVTNVEGNLAPLAIPGIPGTAFAFSFGGGVDVLLSHHINVRGEYEYQSWPGESTHGITPTVASVGVAYRFR